MLADAVSDRETVLAAFDAYDAACEQLAALDFSRFTVAELLELQSRREHRTRTGAITDHRILATLQAQACAKDLGGKSWTDVLATRMRISRTQAARRVADAQELGPRHTVSGETLAPVLAATAQALAAGTINTDHVHEIRAALHKATEYITPSRVTELEHTLVGAAAAITPDTLKKLAAHALYLLNQDGTSPDPATHKRGVKLGGQDADGLTRISGWADPELAAYLGTVLAVWGAPGINNPADPQPLHNPTPNPLMEQDDAPTDTADQAAAAGQAELDAAHQQAQAAARDDRTLAQRHHDALKVMCRNLLMSKQLGQHNGLPVTVVISTTLAELESGTGLATTSTGTAIPIPDLIRLAEHAHHYLVVYRHHTAEPLYLGRTKRLATTAQRLVLYNRDRGCTKPDCTAPAHRCQGHHAHTDWSAGGQTDITDLGLSCGPHNRLASQTAWTTTIDPDTGRVEWTPPPLLNTGQDTVNHHFHPEELLHPDKERDDGDDP